ncbi:MAG TPA: ABC transporter permease [Acidimicrobiales bacterium]|nr:ABC transporter permease [Acidimicrobiales bacterium]
MTASIAVGTSPLVLTGSHRVGRLAAFAALAGRRLTLSLRTPRAVVLPLATPVLIAVVIAPALAKTASPVAGMGYMTYLAVGTVALVVPLSCMQAGLGAIVDRNSGAQPDLLAAPVPRSLIVLANLAAALVTAGLQVTALVGFSIARGASLRTSAPGLAWFAAGVVLLAVATYGVAEVLANRIGAEEEYVNAIPTVGIAPWFFAGSLFPITSLPGWLAAITKALPVTHAIALMRYGVAGHNAAGLHAIWGLHDPTTMACLSVTVLGLYAAALTALALRIFTHEVVR